MQKDLFGIKNKRYKIASLKERIARLRSVIEFGDRRLDGGPRTPDHDKMAAKIARLIDLEADLLEEVGALECDIRAAEYSIDALPDQQRVIVRLRDIDGKTWGEIARSAKYDRRHCARIYAAAAKKIRGSF